MPEEHKYLHVTVFINILTCSKPEIRFSTQARKLKPLLHCTESLKHDVIKTFCL